MLTLATLIPLAVVPATFHPKPRFAPAVRMDVEFRLVMAKLAPVLTTCTCISAEATPPPPALLSRTRTRNFIALRATVGRRSTAPPPEGAAVLFNPARIVASLGNIRVGLVDGTYGRNSGLAPLSADVRFVAAPRS